MASTLVYDAVKTHLQATFAPTPVIDFDTLDNALQQGQNDFLCLQEAGSIEDEIGFGNPNSICVREVSGLLVICFVPAPQSSGRARTLGDSVQQALRLQTLAGTTVLDVSPPEPEIQNDGLWTSAVVTITVTADRHVAKL
jgi:hypothetical protein